jgi:hypothetical protein
VVVIVIQQRLSTRIAVGLPVHVEALVAVRLLLLLPPRCDGALLVAAVLLEKVAEREGSQRHHHREHAKRDEQQKQVVVLVWPAKRYKLKNDARAALPVILQPPPFSDANVANRTSRVWHGATENDPWTMDNAHTFVVYV